MKRILPAALLFCSTGLRSQEIESYFSATELKKANTASAEGYLTTTEKEVYQVLNLARIAPKKFLGFLTAYLGNKGGDLLNNSYCAGLSKDLKKMKALAPLYPDRKMHELAKCWAVEAGKMGLIGHERKKCRGGFFAECCSYGRETAVEVVMSFLIDEGVSSLGHRRICLSAEYGLLGVSQQDHKSWGSNTVLDFTYARSLASK